MNGSVPVPAGKRMSVAELKVMLLEHVARRRPMSVIRFNDGEGKLVGCGTHYAHAELMQMLDRWFADNRLTLEQLRRLQDAVIEATLNADVVGSPDADWPAEFAKANAVLGDLAGDRRLATVLVNFSQAMLLDGFLTTLLHRIGFVGLVSARDVRGVVKHLFDPAEIAWWRVPEQGIYSYQANLPRHFPESFDFLCSRIEVPFIGALFLVGAGPCGKVYCDVIKRRGGIAIDIGSVFDVWAGRLTRPEMSFDAVRGYYERHAAVPSPLDADLLALAEIHQNGGDLGRSLDLLRMGLRLRPGSVSLGLKAAECLLLLGDALSAKGIYDTLAQPGSFGSAEMLAFARLFARHDRLDHAGAILVQALHADPADAATLRMALTFFTDTDGIVAGQKPSLRADLRVAGTLAADRNGQDHALFFALARYLGAMGDVREAARWGGKAIALFGVQPDYYRPAIEWRAYLGEQEEAARLQQLLSALDRRP